MRYVLEADDWLSLVLGAGVGLLVCTLLFWFALVPCWKESESVAYLQLTTRENLAHSTELC